MTSEEKILHPQLRPVIPGCAWSARGLLTEAEALDLQDKAMEQGMRHVENNGEALTTDARLRDCVRASLDVPELAETVFKRIQPFLEPEITVDGTEESRMLGLPYGDVALLGVWRPCGVNPIIRICKYPGDGRGHFGPHHDSAVTLGTHERSLLTLNGYLNALPEGAGGCTRFLIDELPIYKDERGRFTIEDPASQVRAQIRPEAPGDAAVFYHGLMHDSEPLAQGAPPKWIWRTEVMYKRDEATAPTSDPTMELVRSIERAAEKIERDDAMRSMQLYQLAQRLRDGRTSAEAAQVRFDSLKPDHSDGDEKDEVDTDTEA